MRKILLILLVLIMLPILYVVVTSYEHADLGSIPELQSGDLIFQTAITPQSPAIVFATGSIYTHVGIIHKHEDGGYSVIHAGRTVIETSLAEFIERGWGQRLTIKRYPSLSGSQQAALIKDAEHYLGTPYNYVFYMASKDTVYCSQVPYNVFEAEHLPLGTIEKIGDLHMNNPAVKKLFSERWTMHPACQAPGMDEAACWKTVIDEPIITPVSLERDPKLESIYSNYLL